MSEPISFMSPSVMPCVVTAGRADPHAADAIDAGCGSYGMAFLLSTIPAASQRASASLPETPMPCRSSSARWVSVPPVTGRMPSAASASVRAWRSR